MKKRFASKPSGNRRQEPRAKSQERSALIPDFVVDRFARNVVRVCRADYSYRKEEYSGTESHKFQLRFKAN